MTPFEHEVKANQREQRYYFWVLMVLLGSVTALAFIDEVAATVVMIVFLFVLLIRSVRFSARLNSTMQLALDEFVGDTEFTEDGNPVEEKPHSEANVSRSWSIRRVWVRIPSLNIEQIDGLRVEDDDGNIVEVPKLVLTADDDGAGRKLGPFTVHV